MKKVYFIILIIGIIILTILIYNKLLNKEEQIQFPVESSSENNLKSKLPIEQARDRVIKKPFGIKVSPEDSPISPERFSGYHAGIDYEIFENEIDIDVEIFAICNGRLLKKEIVSGYGGILVQECELGNQSVTVIYGHIDINSVQQEIEDYLSMGKTLALLGQAFSSDTDGERKHLHLGIHKGNEIDIRGYVSKKSDLNNWINFEEYIKN